MELQGITVKKTTAAQLTALRRKFGEQLGYYDLMRQYALPGARKAGLLNGLIVPREGMQALLLVTPPRAGMFQFSIIQEESQGAGGPDKTRIVGGSTFVVRTQRIG